MLCTHISQRLQLPGQHLKGGMVLGIGHRLLLPALTGQLVDQRHGAQRQQCAGNQLGAKAPKRRLALPFTSGHQV
jgi:hypothetical protein